MEMVGLGWSRYETKWGKSEKYDEAFREAEEEAKRMKCGIWRD